MPFSFHTMFNLVIASSYFLVAFTFIVIFRLFKRKHPYRDGLVSAAVFFILLIGLGFAGRGVGIPYLADAFYLLGMFVYMAFLAALFISIVGWVIVLDSKLQLAAIAIITVVLFSVGIYDAQTFDIKTITITSDRIDREYNLVFFSDVHVGSESPAWLEKIIAAVESLEPDIVLFGGDLVDDGGVTRDDLKALTSLDIPTYMVYGNHDSMVMNSPQMLSPVKILDDSLIDFDGLELIGINYRSHRGYDVVNVLDRIKMDPSMFRIMLVHAPVGIEDAAERGIDLILAAHTHGGQVFPYHLIHEADFGYLYGLYDVNGTGLYVTSGAGVWGPNFRFGSRNEIVHVVLKPAEGSAGDLGSCSVHSDCELPMEFAIQSNCPFGTACIDEGCRVVCPLMKYVQDSGVRSVRQVSCEADSDCDCSERENRTLDCLCVDDACLSVES